MKERKLSILSIISENRVLVTQRI